MGLIRVGAGLSINKQGIEVKLSRTVIELEKTRTKDGWKAIIK